MKKYNVSSIREAETKDLDISRFFDTDEKVIITIRRMTAKQRNEITLLTLKGQKVNMKNAGVSDNEEEVISAEMSVNVDETSWYTQVRMKQLVYSVVQNDNFPFECWNEQLIDEIDERNPDLIQFLQNAVQKFNLPLAKRKSKK